MGEGKGVTDDLRRTGNERKNGEKNESGCGRSGALKGKFGE